MTAIAIWCSFERRRELREHRSHTPVLANAKFSKVKDPALNTDLLDMERKMIAKNYKFGILYVKEGQTKENEMFANVETSAAFDEFLEFLGNRIVLRDWKGFRGGLDVNRDSTGTHSVHTRFKDFEIMFHVSTLLPFNPADEQQLERKRHLGNDIVVIIFVDGSTPFSPSLLKSEFNHTFVVVQPHASPQDDGKTFYKIGFADKVGVRSYAPLLPDPPVFEKNQAFRHWFMTKLVNAERASLHAPGFKGKIQRTRMLLLKDMIEKYCKKDIMPNADSFSMG
ncbi:RapGAP/RanGAP domain containing protein [Acanthamoeba castellanii str. Neff]|uniref:RapGAP/RanGAP domain containing protein n=1 Tax=Acanthamoeba castellanii (strain ATCC 30010 / Neff) TaxID=1257118 RepID=L8GG36_ACACF|nr:RapGAP/RanGAP domain containing protein [Acanthamoeba castellanii str. Neff]ELR11121.1 RapGAP/RanGAP domain containing protein [Acanthamoeba castellanii str. Neff]